jgi:hypothetical protein
MLSWYCDSIDLGIVTYLFAIRTGRSCLLRWRMSWMSSKSRSYICTDDHGLSMIVYECDTIQNFL